MVPINRARSQTKKRNAYFAINFIPIELDQKEWFGRLDGYEVAMHEECGVLGLRVNAWSVIVACPAALGGIVADPLCGYSFYVR